MTKKIVATILGLSMMVMLIPSANAATVEELQAQIAALTAQLAALQTQLTALGGTPTTGAPAACTGITFATNLSQGSSGADVKCLQALLNQSADTQVAATGVGSAGNETIYFGPLTAAAVKKFQEKYAAEILTPLGLTAGTGFVGSSTRAKLNALLAGAPTTPPTTPTTPGAAEGILTAEANPSPAAGTKLYEGDTDAAVLGILLKAKISDIYIQRVTLNFGTTRPYDYLSYLTLYEDGSAVVGKTLDSTSVYKSGSNYYIQLSGFSVKVPKDGSKVLTVKVNANSALPSYLGTPPFNITATVDINGVRGVDTANVIQYAPGEAFSRTFSVDSTLAANAAISIARNANSPLPSNIGAGTLGTAYGVTLLLFDIKAEYDTVKITDIDDVAFNSGTGSATETTAYLYDGSTLLGSASVSSNLADFNDLSIVVNKDATKTLTIKADYTGLTTSKSTSTVTVNSATTTAENSMGLNVTTKSGTASSYTLDLYTVAPALSLTSATITKTTAPYEGASSSADAQIKFTLTAQGGDVTVTTTGAITAGYTTTTYADAEETDGVSVTYGIDGAVEADNVYTIAKNTTATVTVDVKISCGTLPAVYQSAFGYVTLTGLVWNLNKTTNHFVDIFKTGKVYLP